MKNRQRQIAGRLGGLQTVLRHGRDHMREIGVKGGRPKLPTLEELQQTIPAVQLALNKSEEDRLPNGLKELRRLYKRSKSAMGGAKIKNLISYVHSITAPPGR